MMSWLPQTFLHCLCSPHLSTRRYFFIYTSPTYSTICTAGHSQAAHWPPTLPASPRQRKHSPDELEPTRRCERSELDAITLRLERLVVLTFHFVLQAAKYFQNQAKQAGWHGQGNREGGKNGEKNEGKEETTQIDLKNNE